MSENKVSALPSSEALQVLLSPDGYYKYLCIEKPALKPLNASLLVSDKKEEDGVDGDAVKKNYRRLSLKHHPDRKTGDAETFRVLNRAQKVLTTPKLRKQYDLVGLDLDDDDDDHHNGNDDDDGKEGDGGEKGGSSSGADTVMSHIASATIAGIMQAAVRTAMMTFVSTFVTRYKYIVYIAVLLLLGLALKIFTGTKAQINDAKFAFVATCPTVMIAMGIYLMYSGRNYLDEETQQIIQWSYTFCFGEIMVMTMFIQNSIPTKSKIILILSTIFSTITCLILRGKFWRYASVLGFEILIGVIAVLAFPIMEMILEEVVNEKLRKVGEKVRAHNERMEKVRYGTNTGITNAVKKSEEID